MSCKHEFPLSYGLVHLFLAATGRKAVGLAHSINSSGKIANLFPVFLFLLRKGRLFIDAWPAIACFFCALLRSVAQRMSWDDAVRAVQTWACCIARRTSTAGTRPTHRNLDCAAHLCRSCIPFHRVTHDNPVVSSPIALVKLCSGHMFALCSYVLPGCHRQAT